MPCFTALLLAVVSLADKPEPTPPIVIVGVTVIDTRGGPSTPGRTVVIRGESVAMILPDENYSPISPNALIIDGHGKFLIPGLWDMHVHCVREGNLNPNQVETRSFASYSGSRSNFGHKRSITPCGSALIPAMNW